MSHNTAEETKKGKLTLFSSSMPACCKTPLKKRKKGKFKLFGGHKRSLSRGSSKL
jgi:hypothetical protein